MAGSSNQYTLAVKITNHRVRVKIINDAMYNLLQSTEVLYVSTIFLGTTQYIYFSFFKLPPNKMYFITLGIVTRAGRCLPSWQQLHIS